MPTYEFQVDVTTQYLPEQSEPSKASYRFAYTIHITNVGEQSAQLVAREWHIRNSRGQVQVIRGLGVVGRQPLLQPGQAHTYTSSCVLATPHGTMQGKFVCVGEDAEVFYADIPLFVLDAEGGADSASSHDSATPRVLH